MQTIKTSIDLVRAGYAGLAMQMGGIPAIISSLMAGFSGMLVPVLSVVAVIGVLVAAFVTLWKTNETFRNKIVSDVRKYCGVDFGLDNLMSCGFSDVRPMLINGRPLKSINWYYNKKKAELQSLLKNKYTSNRITNLTIKRNNKINNYLHKSSRLFIPCFHSLL